MKRTTANIGLTIVLVGSIIWAAVAHGMVALIPTFLAICAGEGLLSINTDYVKNC